MVLDPDFIPCHLNVVGISALHRFINEMSGLMRERAKNIAQRISSPAQGGVADVSDFMLLQALNRLQPQMKHLAELRSLHPERLFECLSCVCVVSWLPLLTKVVCRPVCQAITMIHPATLSSR
ncbi:type VI secretion system protein ImpJ [Vibrio cholerae]|nr:type VI secretion system protein ImpJ [Vibrio cholerae]